MRIEAAVVREEGGAFDIESLQLAQLPALLGTTTEKLQKVRILHSAATNAHTFQ